MDEELKQAIAVIFQYIEETQAGDWNELKEMLEELEQAGTVSDITNRKEKLC